MLGGKYKEFCIVFFLSVDEELLTAQPSENTLILIYRDMDTLKFIKRVTNEITFMQRKEYHDMSLVYYE